MKDISSPHWDRVRDFIRLQRKQNKSWDNERLNPSAEKLQSNIDDGFFPSDLNLDIWRAIIESEKKAETDAQEIIRQLEASSIDATLGPKELPQVSIPQTPQSCWRLFKNYLKDKLEVFVKYSEVKLVYNNFNFIDKNNTVIQKDIFGFR